MITRQELGIHLARQLSPSYDSEMPFTNAYQNSFVLGKNQENGLTLRLRDTYDLSKLRRKKTSIKFPYKIDSLLSKPPITLVSLLLTRELDSVAAIHYVSDPAFGLKNEGACADSQNGVFRFNDYWIDIDIPSRGLVDCAVPFEAMDVLRFKMVTRDQYAQKNAIGFEGTQYDVRDPRLGVALLKAMLENLNVPEQFSTLSNTGEDRIGDLRALDIRSYNIVTFMNQEFGAMTQTDQINWRARQSAGSKSIGF